MRNSPLRVIVFAFAVSLVMLCPAGARADEPKRSPAEREDEAKRTGRVPRDLRGKLLIETVRGKLQLTAPDGQPTEARLVADSREVHEFFSPDDRRGGIKASRWVECQGTYFIPGRAAHFFLVRPYMDGRRVEAQFILEKPGGSRVADVRFLGVLRGQEVPVPTARGGRPDKAVIEGRAFFVAPNGRDDNPGSLERPFKTIRKGLSVLRPGDTLYLRAGRYHEAIEISGLQATAQKPITIAAYKGEQPVVDATEDLEAVAAGPWKARGGGVFERPLRRPAWQVWMDGKMLVLARWPNVKKNWTEPMSPRFNGRVPEPGTAWDAESYFARFDPLAARANFATARLKKLKVPLSQFAPTKFDVVANVKKLAFRSLRPLGNVGSLVGAVVEGLSPSPAVVTHHEPGSDRLEVVFDNFTDHFLSQLFQGRFVLKNHLALLDRPGEWALDPRAKTLYLKLGDGDHPRRHRFRVKAADLDVSIRRSSHIRIRGIRFFGCRLTATDSPGTVVEGCVFSYPTYRKTALLPLLIEAHARSGLPKKTFEDKFLDCALRLHAGGVVRDCEVVWFQGGGVEIQGSPAVVGNCLFHLGEGGAINFCRSPGAVARRNTIHDTLRHGAIYIRKTPEGHFTAELNYGYNFGTWRSDASGVQVQSGSQNFLMARRNWFHHSECKAVRCDGCPAGSLATIVGNVGWNLWQGLQVKGDYQKTFNNTMFECGRRHDISIINQIAFGGGQHSITRNNLADRLSGHRTIEDLDGLGRIPGFHSHNWNGLVTGGKVRDLLRDPDNFDFRPRKSPQIADAGTTVVDERFVPGDLIDNLRFVKVEGGNPDAIAPTPADARNSRARGYIGRAPDIGAYEFGASHYWIPGRQLRRASFPIPPDGARFVKTDADLMWLEGRNAVAHHVYFGTDRTKVERADTRSPEFAGRFVRSNIFTPPAGLEKGVRYYWRVDAVEADGTVVKGEVWTFLPCDGHYDRYVRLPAPANIRARVRPGPVVVLSWNPVVHPRLAGYNLYRRWDNAQYVKVGGLKLNADLLTATTFTDKKIDGRGRLYYIVEAVDKEGIPSFQSQPLEVRIE